MEQRIAPPTPHGFNGSHLFPQELDPPLNLKYQSEHCWKVTALSLISVYLLCREQMLFQLHIYQTGFDSEMLK